MQTITEFLKSDRVVSNESFNGEVFDAYCTIFEIEACEYRGFSSNDTDLYSLMDHLHAFKDRYGKVYYLSNTYFGRDKIVEVLTKYNLQNGASIMGRGFHHPDTTAVIFTVDAMKELKKALS